MEQTSFKTFGDWFRLMWSNAYIIIFVLALAAFIGMWVSYGITLPLLLPVVVMGVVAYKGFYQFWKDMQNKKSR